MQGLVVKEEVNDNSAVASSTSFISPNENHTQLYGKFYALIPHLRCMAGSCQSLTPWMIYLNNIL